MARNRKPLRRMAATVAAFALVAAACGDDDGDSLGTITVGSKAFTEQLVLGHMTALVLEDAGYNVRDEIGLQSTQVVRDALVGDDIDMYWEYLGTGWIEILANEASIPDKQEQYEAVRDADAANGIVWLEPTDFNNTYALATNQANAAEHGLTSISDIARLVDEDPSAVSFCSGGEFRTRPDGLPGVQSTYGFELPPGNVADVADALVYPQVAGGDCLVGSVFSTSGEISHLDLVVLEDDDAAWPLYYAALTVREEVLEEHPGIADLFGPISAALDQETMTTLNAEVDVNEREPEDVAEEWLTENGFIG